MGTSLPVTPVQGFDADAYLGTWHEIARLDHSFERGLNTVTATYSYREDGGIKVVNTGCDYDDGKWKTATGKAYFTKGETTGQLKVSFFGPFYGPYIVFDKDPASAEYAYVSSGTDKFLWLLARSPEVSEARKADFISKSKALGYDPDKLLWVEHTDDCPAREG